MELAFSPVLNRDMKIINVDIISVGNSCGNSSIKKFWCSRYRKCLSTDHLFDLLATNITAGAILNVDGEPVAY